MEGGLQQAKAYGKEIKRYINDRNSGIGKQTPWFPGKAKAKHALLHWRREDKSVYRHQDSGQERRNHGKSDHFGTVETAERCCKDDHLRQRK